MRYTGACRYCGQVINTTREFSTQSEADEYASENCRCDESVIERERQQQIYYAKERVRQLFGADAARYGFEPVKEAEVLTILNSIVESVAHGRLNWATLRIRGGGKATITATARGGIRVQRSITHACELDG